MQENKGFPTKEKAIEAWQTWKGHYCDLDPGLFRKVNSQIDWDYFKKLDLKTISIKDEESFEAPMQMLTNRIKGEKSCRRNRAIKHCALSVCVIKSSG